MNASSQVHIFDVAATIAHVRATIDNATNAGRLVTLEFAHSILTVSARCQGMRTEPRVAGRQPSAFSLSEERNYSMIT